MFDLSLSISFVMAYTGRWLVALISLVCLVI
jgi:hypothetical protein